MHTLIAPGQGSQTPGMLTDWLKLPGARDQLARWSNLTNLDLELLGTTAGAEKITDTAITQPLVVATSLLAYAELVKHFSVNSGTIVAGHSVGELTAYAIAGVISADEAVTLASIRGTEMARACALESTTMAAVLGGDENEVISRLEELDLVPANRNAVGQIVAAGKTEAIEELVSNPPAKTRTRKLAVAGAFHTLFMAPARDAVAKAAENIIPSDPTCTLLSNSDGEPVTTGREALKKLVSQITNPVRWDLCSNTMRKAGTTAIIELPPSGALVGIAKRELKGIPTLALKTPASISGITELG